MERRSDDTMRIFKGLVAEKEKYIGGKLEDYGDPQDRRWAKAGIIDGPVPVETTITDITLIDDYFSVIGEQFTCACTLNHLHVTHNPEFPCENGIAFIGYGGHEWHIYPKGE